MFLLMKFGTKLFIKVLSVPANYLYPIILILCVLGAFGERNNLFDVWCMLGLGLIAYFMNKLKFPTTPIILGFIIGSMVETNLRRGLMQSDGSFLPFFTRPLSAVFWWSRFYRWSGPSTGTYKRKKMRTV
jgi:putative tricarboxylic transport membrane protein